MSYQTYRNIYRIRPALSSVGQGRSRLRLPQGMSITLDVALLSLVLWMPFTVTIGYLVHFFMVEFLPAWLIGLAASFIISYQLGKLDPAGKNVFSFIVDYTKFLFRHKHTDGFDKQPKIERFEKRIYTDMYFTMIEEDRIGAMPSMGKPYRIEFLVPLKVVSFFGYVYVNFRYGKKYEPGLYEIEGKKLVQRMKKPDWNIKKESSD